MNNDNLLNEKAGISIEEQREILAQIDGIAEKNRRSLSGDVSSGKPLIKAKKNGIVFPLVVNTAAVIVLLGGAFLLISFNGKMDAQLRTGNAVYSLTERALIDEIRKDTAEALASKEIEISTITSRLSQVDDELLLLYSSNQELTAEQRAAGERLIVMQNAFREELSILHDERSQILENSRSREARLRAQLDERAREYAAAQQKTSNELDFAIKELERLTNEREKFLAMEALFSSIRIDSNEDSRELQNRNMQLQDNISELQKTIDALSSGGTGLTRRISELEGTVSSLQQSSSEKDSAISLLETENTGYASTITQLRSANTTQEQEIANLRNQITIIRQALQEN